MSKNRMFKDRPTGILIIRIERSTIKAIDNATRHRAGGSTGNRSEFIRQAIEERLRQANL